MKHIEEAEKNEANHNSIVTSFVEYFMHPFDFLTDRAIIWTLHGELGHLIEKNARLVSKI